MHAIARHMDDHFGLQVHRLDSIPWAKRSWEMNTVATDRPKHSSDVQNIFYVARPSNISDSKHPHTGSCQDCIRRE